MVWHQIHGKLTSIREPYDMLAMTGASPILPIPCFVCVTNLKNGKAVIIKINDLGPFVSNRIIDLSYAAAKKLCYSESGTALVDVKSITLDFRASNHSIVSIEASLTHPPKLFLQLGAFYKFSHAQNLKIQLHDHVKNPILILKGTHNYLPLYRVQIGPLRRISESNYLQNKLKKLGFEKAVIIVN